MNLTGVSAGLNFAAQSVALRWAKEHFSYSVWRLRWSRLHVAVWHIRASRRSGRQKMRRSLLYGV